MTIVAFHIRVKQDKRTLYVGGLDEDVDVEILKAAFIPFGEVDMSIFFAVLVHSPVL